MKFKILYSMLVALFAINLQAKIDDVIYLQSAFNDGNAPLAEAIIHILPEDKAKKGAIVKFNNLFKPTVYKPASKGPSLEERQKLIASASKELKDLLDKKDLSQKADREEILAFIASPAGSGGKLAKQLGKNETETFAKALIASA